MKRIVSVTLPCGMRKRRPEFLPSRSLVAVPDDGGKFSFCDSVSGSGLVGALRRLALLNSVRANPKQAALMFVVPLGVEQTFTRQKIQLDGLLGDCSNSTLRDNSRPR
jgi:hypothetical protein